jgi:hypothetical protein
MNSAALLHEIHLAARSMGIAPSTLCHRAVKSSKLPNRLAGGGTVTLATAEAIRNWIKKNQQARAA